MSCIFVQKYSKRSSLASPGTFSIITALGLNACTYFSNADSKSLRGSSTLREPFSVRKAENPWHGGHPASRSRSPFRKLRSHIRMCGEDSECPSPLLLHLNGCLCIFWPFSGQFLLQQVPGSLLGADQGIGRRIPKISHCGELSGTVRHRSISHYRTATLSRRMNLAPSKFLAERNVSSELCAEVTHAHVSVDENRGFGSHGVLR